LDPIYTYVQANAGN